MHKEPGSPISTSRECGTRVTIGARPSGPGWAYDERGDHLIPSQATKGINRYRCYVTMPLVTEGRGGAGQPTCAGRRPRAALAERVCAFLAAEVKCQGLSALPSRETADQRRLLHGAAEPSAARPSCRPRARGQSSPRFSPGSRCEATGGDATAFLFSCSWAASADSPGLPCRRKRPWGVGCSRLRVGSLSPASCCRGALGGGSTAIGAALGWRPPDGQDKQRPDEPR